MSFGKIATWSTVTADPVAEEKKVVFRPSTASDTVRIGDLVCYNADLAADWQERTSNPITGTFGASGNETTYAEGAQTYNARFLVVEKPASANLRHFAGVVVALGQLAGADGDLLTIVPLKAGAIVPVYTDASCTIDVTVLGVQDGSYLASQVTGDGDPLGIGVAIETVDRSDTNGLVWVRLFGDIGVGYNNAFFAPTNYRNGRYYGFYISGDNFFDGAAGAQEYLLGLDGDKETASSGDSYGGIIKVSGSNYAANDSNYKFYGINCGVSNREDGTLGHIYGGNFSISLKGSSGNITTGIALTVDAQDLTTGTKSYFGGMDVAINREGTAATEEFGIRIRTRGTINTAMNTVFRIDKDATDHGFINLFNIESDAVDYAACTGDVTVDSNDKVIPIVLGGSTFYLIAVDSIPSG